MTVAAMAMVAMKVLMFRTKRRATRRQSLRRQNIRSMMLRCLKIARSWGILTLRLFGRDDRLGAFGRRGAQFVAAIAFVTNQFGRGRRCSPSRPAYRAPCWGLSSAMRTVFGVAESVDLGVRPPRSGRYRWPSPPFLRHRWCGDPLDAGLLTNS